MEEVNKRLSDGTSINSYDVLVARKIYDIDSVTEFFFQPKFGSPRYSEACVEWFLKHHSEDPLFLIRTRENYYTATH